MARKRAPGGSRWEPRTAPQAFRRAAVVLLCALPLVISPLTASASPAPAAQADATGDRLDAVTFGDSASEEAHAFTGGSTTVVDGAGGRTARVAEPLSPAGPHLGDLVFRMAVDPARQNYLSLKFWGEDVSGYRTVLYVNGEQANYRGTADYEPINYGTGRGLEGRFFFSTAMLPLASTQGHEKVEIIIRTFPASMTASATEKSRRYYQAITHTSPKISLADADDTGYEVTTKAAPALSAAEEQALIDKYRTTQTELFDALSAQSDAKPDATMSITRYKDDLRFYAETLLTDWSPARTDAEKTAALERIFKSIDNYTRQYYGNVKSLGNGGHQSDWGGYYGALGEALYIVENLIADEGVYGEEKFAALLDEPFTTGTTDGANSLAGTDFEGGELTRGEAWERVLKANFDFARSRLSYIYNQVMYTYEGAWKAHEGLRVIGSEFYEGRARSHAIVGESLGSRPFLGEEVLVGPDGGKLDLYHSLFQHDGNAVYTDDYLQVVMKGLAKSKLDADGDVVRRLPYGKHYTGITAAGLTRENGYVGSYGESANYLTSWFFRTLGHAGDEKLNEEILKLALTNIHARGQTRYQGTDADGYRVMVMQQVVDDRNTAYPGKISYGTDTGSGRGLAYASLEQYMADHQEKYAGDKWAKYWRYAREAVGYGQQQLVDNQYFKHFSTVLANHRYDLRLPRTYAYVTGGRGSYERFGQAAAGVVLPHTDLDRYTDEELTALGVDRDRQDRRFAWVDIDNLFVSARDGDKHLFGNLFERNKGFAGNGRLHAQYDGEYEQLVQVRTQGEFRSKSYYPRAASAEENILHDRYTKPDRPLALAGELIPVTHQPGVGTVERDNYLQDTPYAGYPDLLTTRYGQYFMAINTTRKVYGNERAFDVRLPRDFTGSKVRDLVSGRQLPVRQGKVELVPFRAVVLDLGTDRVAADVPSAVDVAVTTPGSRQVGLTWSRAAGATSYTIERATTATGRYRTVAKGVKGVSYVDDSLPVSKDGKETFSYRVVPVNGQGSGRASNPARAVVKPGATAALRDTAWRDDAIGGAGRGAVSVSGDTVTVKGASGDGFGGGDDAVHVDRFHSDAYTQVSRLVQGGTAVSAKLAENSAGDGGVRGVILRDTTDAIGRYVYLGADAKGALQLRHRSLDTRQDIGIGLAGRTASGGMTRSPFTQDLKGYGVGEFPYVKLVRLPRSDRVLALVSPDGVHWQQAGEASVPMVDVVHAGVAADRAGAFTRVTTEALADDTVIATGRFGERTGTVSWTKPKAAVAFDLYRTSDPETAATDPRAGGAGWQKLLDDRYAQSYKDKVYGGQMYYKVVARTVDGATSVTAEPALITADSLASVLQQARALAAEDYTPRSFARFTNVVDAVEEAAKEPGVDESALIKRVYEAYDLLAPVYHDSFEPTDPDVWQQAGTGPYTLAVDTTGGRTGDRALSFTSTDTSGSASFNQWFHNRGTGTSPITAQPGKAYTVSFWYQVKDYVPGTGVGAYAFVYSRSAASLVGSEQRNWLPKGDTADGQWKYFERTYTTVDDPSVDNISIDFGLRGSSGRFRVDDLKVSPVESCEVTLPYTDGFEVADCDLWQQAGTGPYTLAVDDTGGRAGGRALSFTSTDTSGSAALNQWFHNRKSGASPIKATGGKTYKVSFRYQLKDYVPGTGVGAYAFVYSRSGGTLVGSEQRNWLPKGDTAEGEWRLFERTYTTVNDGRVDNISIDLGLRGSAGRFRVDDLRVEAVD
ncbi:Tat pathway signal protein [Streptomyces sp. NPDC012510]|uniref:Tat pathway signal protein n=1 Tax=Streptomyces sp. NPDC012510 TaxID=3364838 RepID=UPI0036F12A6A